MTQRRRRISRDETRYKGVWDSGYDRAMVNAAATLTAFVSHGGDFSADAGDAFVRNTLLLRLGDRIVMPDREAIVAGMKYLLERPR